jgi:Ca2+-transporting ATPase
MESLPPYVLNKGLRGEKIAALRSRFGTNEFISSRKAGMWHIAWQLVREPMFFILLLACILYFVLGENEQGAIMLAAILFVSAISFFQEVKSGHAMSALRKYTRRMVLVIRDNTAMTVSSTELVPGDLIVLQEGDLVPADAMILRANDLSVDESILTGESFPVDKNETGADLRLYQGTTLNAGSCYATVTETGFRTELGKLGRSIEDFPGARTALQLQIGRFVRIMAISGIAIFLLLCLINYFHTGNFLQSLLSGLVFAMAIIPEEIPVAFSSFMALGAYHMSKWGIITREPLTIENMGAVTMICLDKTGTITENRMTVRWIYDHLKERLEELPESGKTTSVEVLAYGRLASERIPFDAMEKAIVEAYERSMEGRTMDEQAIDARHFNLGRDPDIIHEYPVGGRPPMMTHVYEKEAGEKLVAGKGAPERVMEACRLAASDCRRISDITDSLARQGFRVLGICGARFQGEEFPADQDGFDWQFKGLLALYDPPKAGVASEFVRWRNAGIGIRLVTGDFPETALTIARLVGLDHEGRALSGEEVMRMEPASLYEAARQTAVFARMFPEAKRKLIAALQANGEIVAMMGDGVNDGPALRTAHIGIAMGGKGTEIARQAADLILTDDNLSKVTEAIRQGRKIYYNLKKAIRYIVSIHIPILLVASLPLLLNWEYPNIFTPIHIIFLELIMGPTCSVFFENEPSEPHMMDRPPRSRSGAIFTARELAISFVQGAVIGLGVLLVYYFFMERSYSIPYVRTMVFITLIVSNIFLTFINRSFEETIVRTIGVRNRFTKWIIISSLAFLAMLIFVQPIRVLFGLMQVTAFHYLVCLMAALVITVWFDVYKLWMARKIPRASFGPPI